MCQFHAAARSLPDNGDPGRPERNDAAAVDIHGNRAGRTPVLPVLSGRDQVTAFGTSYGRWSFG
jgi:hypothetical protein